MEWFLLSGSPESMGKLTAQTWTLLSPQENYVGYGGNPDEGVTGQGDPEKETT